MSGGAQPDGATTSRGALAPLRHPLFRAVWLASLASNFGGLIQSVGASWLTTSLTTSANLPAGSLFDRDDRARGVPGLRRGRGVDGHSDAASARGARRREGTGSRSSPHMGGPSHGHAGGRAHRVVLIGDSGQHDPELYARIVDENHGRVLAVYIRDVSRKPGRGNEIQTLAAAVEAAGSTLILSAKTLSIAKHAAGLGLLAPDAVAAIEVEEADEVDKASGR